MTANENVPALATAEHMLRVMEYRGLIDALYGHQRGLIVIAMRFEQLALPPEVVAAAQAVAQAVTHLVVTMETGGVRLPRKEAA